jgi:hypothetical protein
VEGLIDALLPPFVEASDPETEEAARQEKARALEEIYRSRFSVLIGPAGTGKTSLLTALISMPSVAEGGVLLLAPTGKARVQMQKRAKSAQAFTLAQFLLKLDRYDAETGAYRMTGEPNREKGLKLRFSGSVHQRGALTTSPRRGKRAGGGEGSGIRVVGFRVVGAATGNQHRAASEQRGRMSGARRRHAAGWGE